MGLSTNNQNTSSLSVAHTSTLAAGEIAATVINTVTAALSANQSNSGIATQCVLTPSSAAGSPCYYVGCGAEVDITSAANNNLANATIYAQKGIINFSTAATSGNVSSYIIVTEAEFIYTGNHTSGSITVPNVVGYLLQPGPFTQAAGGTTSITDYKGIHIKPISYSGGGTVSITNQWNLYVEDTAGGSYFGSPILCIGAAAPAVGAITHRGTGGFRTESASTQDAIKIVGRAGGTGSYNQIITTGALTASRTLTLPDADLTITGGGTLSLSSGVITSNIQSISPTVPNGYNTGAGGTVTQATSRTTSVTLNKVCGAITLVSAAGSSAWNSFTVNNSTVSATDTVIVNVKTATDIYLAFVSTVAAGSFKITVADLTGTTTEAPVLNFAVIKAVAA